MANEKKNGTLEEIIMEMLKEGKAVRIPIRDVVDKQRKKKTSRRMMPMIFRGARIPVR